jgi:dolichol-phosphate mannosyltransferase
MKKISIIVPVYNEASSIHRLFDVLQNVLKSLPYTVEYVFVNDGSTDTSDVLLTALATDSSVKYIELSRNFGKEVATSAGIAYAQGDALVIIDADLQHPPEIIPTFVRAWEEGADVVVGVRRRRKGEGFIRRLSSRGFTRIMNSISNAQTPQGATDFRLIDRRVADVFRTMQEHNRLTRSLIDWLGFKRVSISFDAREREDGVARYSYYKLFSVAFSAIVAHSRLPLYFAGYLGVGITCFAGLLGVFVIIEQIILGDPFQLVVSGTAMLAIMILFLNGIVLMCLGLVALYIGTIHEETAKRPLWVVRRSINSDIV